MKLIIDFNKKLVAKYFSLHGGGGGVKKRKFYLSLSSMIQVLLKFKFNIFQADKILKFMKMINFIGYTHLANLKNKIFFYRPWADFH